MAQQNMNAVFYSTTYHPIQAGSIDGTDTTSHDNGVYRALLAASTGLYDPTGDPKAEGDPYCTLFVGRLARHTTEKTLHEVMSKYGKIKNLRMARHIVTGASRGYAFVEFEDEENMLSAYEVAQHHVIDGSPILVDYNRQQLMPGWIPRRLGGGFGGCKESGQLRFGGRDRPFRAPLRTIPTEELTKMGIPLPPVGQYMSRFLLPPIPRRPGSEKAADRHKQKFLGKDERDAVDDKGEFSLRLGRRSRDGERPSSSLREHRSRQRSEEAKVEQNLADRLDQGHEDMRQYRKRSRSEKGDEEFDHEKSSRSGHRDREHRRHHDRDHEDAKRRRHHSRKGEDEIDNEKLTQMGDEDTGSSRHLERRHYSRKGEDETDHGKLTEVSNEARGSSRHYESSSSRSRHRHRHSSGHDERSSSRPAGKGRDDGHGRGHGHRRERSRERSRTPREGTAEHERSPSYAREPSEQGEITPSRGDE